MASKLVTATKLNSTGIKLMLPVAVFSSKRVAGVIARLIPTLRLKRSRLDLPVKDESFELWGNRLSTNVYPGRKSTNKIPRTGRNTFRIS